MTCRASRVCPGPEETQERPACSPQRGAGSHLPLNCGISPVGLFGSPLWQASLVKATVTPQLPSKNPICWLPASWGSDGRWVTELGRTAASLAERGLALDSGEEGTSGGRAVGHVPGCTRCGGPSGRVVGSPASLSLWAAGGTEACGRLSEWLTRGRSPEATAGPPCGSPRPRRETGLSRQKEGAQKTSSCLTWSPILKTPRAQGPLCGGA